VTFSFIEKSILTIVNYCCLMKKTDLESNQVKKNLIDVFEQVKSTVSFQEQRSRAGLMLGLQELGSTQEEFIGAYYPIASNIIVMNKTPLRRILETKVELLQPYSFHILLHEYLHSLGFLDEEITQYKTYTISKKQFGKDHIITQLSAHIQHFFPYLTYPTLGWTPPENASAIELVKGFDSSHLQMYIT